MECQATDENVFNVVPSGESQLYPNASTDTQTAKVVRPNSYEDSLKVYLARQIFEVPEAERVFCRRQDNIYFVWTVIDQLDYDVRRKIYQKQKAIVHLFGDEVFDFYVVARRGKPPGSIISDAEEIVRK